MNKFKIQLFWWIFMEIFSCKNKQDLLCIVSQTNIIFTLKFLHIWKQSLREKKSPIESLVMSLNGGPWCKLVKLFKGQSFKSKEMDMVISNGQRARFRFGFNFEFELMPGLPMAGHGGNGQCPYKGIKGISLNQIMTSSVL